MCGRWHLSSFIADLISEACWLAPQSPDHYSPSSSLHFHAVPGSDKTVSSTLYYKQLHETLMLGPASVLRWIQQFPETKNVVCPYQRWAPWTFPLSCLCLTGVSTEPCLDDFKRPWCKASLSHTTVLQHYNWSFKLLFICFWPSRFFWHFQKRLSTEPDIMFFFLFLWQSSTCSSHYITEKNKLC